MSTILVYEYVFVLVFVLVFVFIFVFDFVFVFIFAIVFVFIFVIVIFLVRSCLLITLIKCLKGHKSLGSLCSVVKTLIVSGNRASKQARDNETY